MSASSGARAACPPRWRRGLLVLIGLSGLAGVVHWWMERPPAVLVEHPTRKTIEQTVVATGRVVAPARVNLGVLIQGVVGKVLVDEGQHVEAGQLLLTLEDDELQALAKQANGSLGMASARLRQLGRVDAKLAREQLERADKELQKATLDHARTVELARHGALPSSQLTDSEAALARAKEQREAATIRVAATGANGSESEVSRASLTNAQGAVEFARARLKYGRVTAPASGVILSRSVEPGDVVGPNRTLLVLSRDGETRVLMQPDERALSVLAVGQLGFASAEAFPQNRFPVRLDWIAPVVDPSRGTIDVKFLVPSPPHYLKPEMTVQVTVQVGRRENALVVGSELALGLDSDAPYVLRVAQNRLERARIELGLRSPDAVEVATGLGEDDWLVVPDPRTPTVGTLVRPRMRK